MLDEEYEAEEELEEGWALPPLDSETGQLRIMREQCSTCIFRPGNRMDLNRGRVRQMLAEVRRADSFVTCHKTLGTGEPGAICKGGSEAYMGQIERIARRIPNGIIEVEEPA